ncbi:MAG: TonB-dependent receptor, partial [Cytophagaceae bacterium]|nr:TonB-dependent receptor [Gemmatimonadaceae bacterium]
VMGAPNGGAPERHLTTAVTVLTADQIAQRGQTNMEELFRSGIPGVVAWNLGATGPFAQIGSVRGSSSFTTNYLKTYIDGIELATPYLLFAIDPFSVERIEVIRGPQGSALYGSDAISGVVQVVTRKGTLGSDWRPRAIASLAGGLVESDFADRAKGAQRHSAMLSSGGTMSSLGFGGTFEGRGALVPGASSGYRGAYGGVRHIAGRLRLEGTMRYADVRFTAPSSPLLATNVAAADLRPFLGDQQIEHETYGVTADYQAHARWRHTLVVGIDRNAGAIAPQREQTTVADALLGATEERVSRTSYRYSTTLDAESAGGTKATFTAGIEHSRLERQRLGFKAVLEGNGTGLASLYSDLVDNTGIFGQFKFAMSDALFLSAGVRSERNSAFGEDYGTALSPMVGAAFVRPLGGATLKVRGAYGKGIRPPPPSARRSIQTVFFRQLPNPDLRPEQQSGIEGGIELYASDHASLSVTAYDQLAEGLIQQVVPAPLMASKTIQYQNVGKIENRGVELEGSARVASLRADVAFSLTDSRVVALAGTYTGDLAVGDRVPEVPVSSGTGSLSWQHRRARATFGVNYIGSWTGYDWLAYYDGAIGASFASPTLRGYFMRYPSITKPFAAFSMDLGRDVSWMLRVDNLTNVQSSERDNLQISAGRTTMLGFRIGR